MLSVIHRALTVGILVESPVLVLSMGQPGEGQTADTAGAGSIKRIAAVSEVMNAGRVEFGHEKWQAVTE